MYLDAKSIPTGTVLETDLCIVGGGAAGITIAREFANSGIRVLLLESGAMEFEPDTQELYVGSSVGKPFQDLTTCRLRYFGGTTNHWGGWCLPLQPIDFEARSGVPHSGWPFTLNDLAPWYARAQEVVQIGAYDYRPSSWGLGPDVIPDPFRGPHFVCKVLQSSPPTRFGPAYGPELKKSSAVSVCFHANVLQFDTNPESSEVQQVRVATLAGSSFTVKASRYVLACGGIENARILLLSGNPNGLGNERDLVGRFFMVHVIYSGGEAVLADQHANLDFFTGRDGKISKAFGAPQRFNSFIGLSEDTMRSRDLSGINIIWLYKFAAGTKGIDALKDILSSEPHKHAAWSDLRSIMQDLGGVSRFAIRKALYHEGVPVEALQLHCSMEQFPNPSSRVRLGGQRDRFDMREIEVDWDLTAEDKRRALQIQRLLGAELGRVGFARLRQSLPDDDSGWPEDMYGDAHHTGTTRMHRDPAQGVVDENCKVHGVANLFVAGSSVFPTSGSANPTLTITALALRLADHFKEQLK